jgi:hypothetical protein
MEPLQLNSFPLQLLLLLLLWLVTTASSSLVDKPKK